MKNIDLLACLVAGITEKFSKQNKKKKKKRNPQKSKGKKRDLKILLN